MYTFSKGTPCANVCVYVYIYIFYIHKHTHTQGCAKVYSYYYLKNKQTKQHTTDYKVKSTFVGRWLKSKIIWKMNYVGIIINFLKKTKKQKKKTLHQNYFFNNQCILHHCIPNIKLYFQFSKYTSNLFKFWQLYCRRREYILPFS